MAGHNEAADKRPSPAENEKPDRRARLFIAMELPDFVKDALAALQAEIRKSGFTARWIPPENIHLTLKFLGDTPVSAFQLPFVQGL